MLREWRTRTWLRLKGLMKRKQLDRDLEDELQFHLAKREEKLATGGADAKQVHFAALNHFGNATSMREATRELWTFASLESLRQDIRFGARTLRKNPGFAVIAVLTLALGIGANIAIFSIVESVLLRPLPFQHSDRLFAVWTNLNRQGAARSAVSMPEFEDYKSESRSFEYLANMLPRFTFTWVDQGEPRVVRCTGISYDFFPMLGIQPLLGRLYTAQEYHVDGQHELISYGFWKNALGGDPNVIGRSLQVSNTSVVVIGVMPPLTDWFPNTDFYATDVPDFDWARVRGNRLFSVVGRLKPGVTPQQAEQELTAILRRGSGEPADASIELVPLKDQIVGSARTGIEIVMGAVGLVLLLALVNVAYLLLARCSKRQTEIAVRLSLGAPRSRIVRQFITENLMLASLGGALGLILANIILRAFTHFNLGNLPRSETIAMDSRVIWFALLITLVTSLVLAWGPTATLSKTDLNTTLKTGRAQTSPATRSRFRLLLVSEVSLALVLVIGASLLVRSFWAVSHADPGFQPDHLMTAYLRTNYDSRDGASFFNRALDRISNVPGVQAVAVNGYLYVASGGKASLQFADRPVDPHNAPLIQQNLISSEYFRTLGIPLLRGRVFTVRDDLKKPAVAIVNDELARRYWPGENPIGKRLAVVNLIGNSRPGTAPAFREVVGVVGNVKQSSRELPTAPIVYTPFLQDETGRIFGSVNLFVRSEGDPRMLAGSIRAAIRAVDPNQPVESLQTMDSFMSNNLAPRRFSLLLVGSFAGLALILAAIGIYGMVSYFVSQRTRELALRMALGAQPGDVLRLVVWQGLKLVSVGLFCGVLAALVLTRFMAGMLFGVTADDPATFSGVVMLLAIVALAACYFPARRAMRVDPMVALRQD